MTDNYPDLFSDLFSELVDTRFFSNNANSNVTDDDIQVAATIFLFEVAKADGVIDRVEITRVIETLKSRFELDGDEVGKLLEQASTSSSQGHDLELFSSKLCDHWSNEQRLKLLKNFWEIALADNVIDQRERDFIRRSAQLLNLDEQESERVALQAENKAPL